MLSQTVEYALRAVICLAQRPDHLLTTQQISQITRVPLSYLSKVLQSLGRAGLITAARGIRGGYMLSIAPSQLTILHVVNAIDPIKRIRHCPLQIESHGSDLCPLHRRLDSVLEQTERVFEDTHIAELLNSDGTDGASVPLCSGNGASTEPARSVRRNTI